MEDELVDILMMKARDPSNAQGTTSAIFLLKSRRGYEIGDQKVPSHLTIVNNDNRQQVVQLPTPMDQEEYMNRVAQMNADKTE